MASLQPNRFTSWKLLPQEEINAAILTFAQLQLVQNDMASAAEQLVNLEYTPDKPIEYAKQKAFLQAQVQTYQHIIDRSNAATATLEQLAAAKSTGLPPSDSSSF